MNASNPASSARAFASLAGHAVYATSWISRPNFARNACAAFNPERRGM